MYGKGMETTEYLEWMVEVINYKGRDIYDRKGY